MCTQFDFLFTIFVCSVLDCEDILHAAAVKILHSSSFCEQILGCAVRIFHSHTTDVMYLALVDAKGSATPVNVMLHSNVLSNLASNYATALTSYIRSVKQKHPA